VVRGFREGEQVTAPHATNVFLGSRIRAARSALGMSQAALAQSLGLSVQQVSKYESGETGIAALRLIEIATVCGVPIGFYFAGLDDADTAGTRLMLETAKTFSALKPKVQKAVADFIRALMEMERERSGA
jgi:transcriptional regulator with XRE-family HTH domain